MRNMLTHVIGALCISFTGNAYTFFLFCQLCEINFSLLMVYDNFLLVVIVHPYRLIVLAKEGKFEQILQGNSPCIRLFCIYLLSIEPNPLW